MLEAAAAAILQPVLQAPTTCAGAPGGEADGGRGQQQHVGTASPGSNILSSSSIATTGMQNMQSLLAASCPWMQWLPDVLAHNPALMLKVGRWVVGLLWALWYQELGQGLEFTLLAGRQLLGGRVVIVCKLLVVAALLRLYLAAPCYIQQTYTTLLSWFEASGHNRLWQLLSTTCRPAWQQLTTAAAAVHNSLQQQLPDAAAAAAVSAHSTQGQQQLVLSGAFELLCPQPWQQQLVLVLAQEPSLLGLLQLLQQLPGIAWPKHKEQQQQHAPDKAVAMDVDCPGAAAGGGGLWASSEALSSWPGAQEWGQGACVETAATGAQHQHQHQQQSVQHDASKVSVQAQRESGLPVALTPSPPILATNTLSTNTTHTL